MIIDKLKLGDEVLFKGENFELSYIVKKDDHGYYLQTSDFRNFKIFKELRIIDKVRFAHDVYGYDSSNGGFPYAETLEDLTKMTNVLFKLIENVK